MNSIRRVRILLFCIVILWLAWTPILASDKFYYYNNAEVPLVISNEKISIQFDSTQGQAQGGATFLAAHPSLTGDPEPDYVGRDYWIYHLKPECTYAAAASDLLSDPAVNRVVPVYLAAADSSWIIVNDIVIVRFQDHLTFDSCLAVIGNHGLTLLDTSLYKHNLWRCALEDTNDSDPFDVGNEIHALAETEWSCADVLVEGKLQSEPSDAYYPNQYYLKNTGQTGGTPEVDIDAELAWQIPLIDSSIKVAIVDDGVALHQEFPVDRILPGFDAAGYDATQYLYDFDPTPGYVHGHGMACAGIVGLLTMMLEPSGFSEPARSFR
jgi:hypothetical protein